MFDVLDALLLVGLLGFAFGYFTCIGTNLINRKENK